MGSLNGRGRSLLLACAAAVVGAFAFAGSAHAADSLYVYSPGQGANLKESPADYSGETSSFSVPFGPYSPFMYGAVQRQDSNGTWVGPTCSPQSRPDHLCGFLVWRNVPGFGEDDWSYSDSFYKMVDDDDDTLGEAWGNPTIPDGNYRVHALQPEAVFGAVSDRLAENYFTVDSREPQTSIDVGPNAIIGTGVPTIDFTFGGNDPNPPDVLRPNLNANTGVPISADVTYPGGTGSGIDYFDCRLDGGSWDHCTPTGGSTPPYTYSLPADEGAHTLDVRAIDKAGNTDSSFASHSWIVDRTPPVITGTDKRRFTLHNGPERGSDFECSDPPAGTPPGASGIDSCTTSPINDEDLGPHTYTVTAVDKAGNSSTKSFVYTIDPPKYGDLIDEDDPLAHYRLDENVGSDAMLDSSGNGHHGIYQNGIALRQPGAPACARRPHPPRACETSGDPRNDSGYFPPRDGHGYVNGITAPTDAYTMEAWVKPADGNNMMVMAHGGGGQLFIQNGRIAFRQTQDNIYGGGPVLTPGEWWHLAATWDGHTTRLYVNSHQVAQSTSANKPPSGTSTFFVGYGDQAPWFHGNLDEVAYYDHALTHHDLDDRYKTATAVDLPSLVAGNDPLNTAGPNVDPHSPMNGGLYAPTKVPRASFHCDDPDGAADVASCIATVDNNPINDGDQLPATPGPHTFKVVVTDLGGNTYTHNHTYEVKPFSSILGHDTPIAYYRLGDGFGATRMEDSSPYNRDGEYKNYQDSGPIGISGDNDFARDFFGAGGYGFVNGIPAPRFQSTMGAWVSPDSFANGSILGHGDAGEIYLSGGYYRFRRMGTTVSASVAPTPRHYQHVVGTWDGVKIRIYVDGHLAGEAESTQRPSSASTFYVGYGELAPWFDGKIDEVSYYDKALDANRVFQHWLADPPPPDSAGPPPAGGGGVPDPSSGSSESGSSAAAGTASVEIPKLNGKKLTALITCDGSGGCAGDASARAKHRSLNLNLGNASYELAGGESGVATFKLTRKAARTLKRMRGGFIEVKLTGTDGSTIDLARLGR